MQIRVSRSRLNLFTGLLSQAISAALGIVLPYLFITSYGSETNGLLSSIGQFFVYFGLLEAGVGTATIQALYRPISIKDKNGINSILAATNIYYTRTGIIYGILVILLSLLYPLFIDSSLPRKTVFWVVILQGASSVWNYLFQAKYNMLLQADGRVYVQNLLRMSISVLQNAGKITAIYLGYNIVVVQEIHLILSVLGSLATYGYTLKCYPWLDLKRRPDFGAISQKNSVLIQYIAWMVFNHTDILMLTFITKNLALVSVYSLYSLVFTMIQNVGDSLSNSYQYKLGAYSQKSIKDMLLFFKKYEILYCCIVSWLNTVAFLMVIPFLRIYIGRVSDADYFMQYLPVLFFIMKLLNQIRSINKQPVEAAGHFRATQIIPLIEMGINLVVSFLLCLKIGIYGVLIGTIVALLFGASSYAIYNNLHIFCCHWWRGMDVYASFIVLASICGLGVHLIPDATSYINWALIALFVAICSGSIFGLGALTLIKIKERIDETTYFR